MDICVTGASRGLGRSLCKCLVTRGHRVWGVARDEKKLHALMASLPQGMFFASALDLGDAASVTAWTQELVSASFVPDIIVLNASIQENDMDAGSYDHSVGHHVLQVNLEGALQCVEEFLPTFLKRGRGRFVAVTSTVALRPSVRSTSYAASKAGLAMAFRTLRLRFAPRSVQFALAVLGPIATEMWEGTKDSFLIPSVDQTAESLASFVLSSAETLHYPFLSTTLLRLSLWMPDQWFSCLSKRFLKNDRSITEQPKTK